MESSGKTFADEDTTEEAAKEEYRKIADRRVRLGLVLSEIGEKNKITVTDDEVSRAVIERARQMPGREKEVWDYYRNNANALAQLRAPIYEDKVVDFILELANVTEKKVSRDELYKDDEEAEKSRRLTAIRPALRLRRERPRRRSAVAMRGGCKSASTAANSSASTRSCGRVGPALWPGNWPISVSLSFKSCITGRSSAPGKFSADLPCRWMFASANLPITIWVTNARSRRNLHEPRADGGRADQPRRTRLRHFFAPAEGAHHLRDRTGRGRHVDAGRGAAAVSRGRQSEEGNLDVHQLARAAW